MNNESSGRKGGDGEMRMRGKDTTKKNISVIFRYADWFDILLMILGSIGAIGDGMSTNCLLVFASRLMNSLGYGGGKSNNALVGNFMDQVEQVSSVRFSSILSIVQRAILLNVFFPLNSQSI